MPPSILRVRVLRPGRSPVRLWLPLFVLWPVALVLIVLSLVLTILADVLLTVLGRPYHRYTMLLLHSLLTLNATRGMTVSVRQQATAFDLTIL